MNTKIFFVILLVLAGTIIFGMRVKSKKGQEMSATASTKAVIPTQTNTLSSQIKTMGAVEVEIKPFSVLPEKDVVFEMSMNTHSVELNYDYTKIITLTDDQGNSYKPTKWTGGDSGHHLSGQLIFAPLDENPKELTITLSDVDNKTDTFVWQLM